MTIFAICFWHTVYEFWRNAVLKFILESLGKKKQENNQILRN